MGENTEVRDAPDDLWIAGVYDTAQGLTFTYCNCLSLLALVKASAGVCVEIVFLVKICAVNLEQKGLLQFLV